MKKTLRILAILLALVLCMGSLAACGTPVEEDDDTTTAPTTTAAPVADDDEDLGQQEEEEVPTDFIGVLISVDGETVTVELYTTVSGEVPTYETFDMKQSIPAGKDEAVIELGTVTVWYVADGKLVEMDMENLTVGGMILFNTAADGTQTIVDLTYQPDTPDTGDVDVEDTENEVPQTENTEDTESDSNT